MALANEGVHVTLTARGAEALAKTAAEIRKASPGVTVTLPGSVTTPVERSGPTTFGTPCAIEVFA